MEINEKKQNFYHNIVDNYKSWAKPWLDELNNISKNKIVEFIKNEEDVQSANDSHKKILNHFNNIENMFKQQKIKSRKVSNVIIVIFSCLIIGLFFLSFYFKNKKIIKEFNEYKNNQLKSIDELNEIKKQSFINLFSNIKKKHLINSVLDETGLSFKSNVYGSNFEQYITNLDNDYIGLKNFGCLNVGDQNVYIGNICEERWEIVTTSSSVTVPYTYYVTDSDGHLNAKTDLETVFAYHHENTPFRNIDTITALGFRNSIVGNDINWVLYPLTPNIEKEKNKVDHLKTKKIAETKSEKIKNVTTFENKLFNLGYKVNIFHADGSIEQEQNILTWFTVGSQEKFVDMRIDLAENNKFSLIDQPLYKFNNALIIKNVNNIDCSWFTLGNVLNVLNYEPKTSLEDNVNLLTNITSNLIRTNIISICEFLNFSKINSMFQINPINYDYSLLEPNNLNLVNNRIDSETILNMGNLTDSLNSVGQQALLDNIRTIHIDQQEKYTLAVYDIDNYYTTNEVDLVTVYAPRAKRYVTISVPYIKYHPYSTQSTGFAIYKKCINSIEKLIENLNITFANNTFSVFDDEQNVYIFFNDTDLNKNNVNNIKDKINSLFI